MDFEDCVVHTTRCIVQSQRVVNSNAFSAFVGTSPFMVASPKPDNLKPAWSEPKLAENLNGESENNAEEESTSHVLMAAVTSKKVEVERMYVPLHG